MRYLFFVCLLVSMNGFGQYKSYVIGVKGDTLNIVDMDGKKQGRWVNTVSPLRGEEGYEEQGIYVDDLKEGKWQKFSLEGDLLATENYKWGNKNGKCYYYTRWGGLVREESWKAVDPENPYDTVAIYDINDPTKIVDHVVVKLDGVAYKHGTWTYYDPEYGTVVKTENYQLDKLKTDTDDLAPIDVTDSKPKAVAKPKQVLDFEKKNSGKKKVKYKDGSTGG